MYKVLIVEDEKVIADTLAAHLNKWGYEAVCVTDFQNVLEEFEREKPHIVLMDIGLPFFNGYHWCTQIRAQSKVPVIFLSSMSDNMNIVTLGTVLVFCVIYAIVFAITERAYYKIVSIGNK